ncbi:MAG TPA: hypothetical protein VHG69_08545 [Thermoleophilaceae bacterium]|nr:hypothetical protein [Thermoleophilaceae bacterium]
MRRLALALSVFALSGYAAPAAMADAQWWDGGIKKSHITNCASIIFNNPYTEEGAWNWGGFWADENNWPNPGEVFYIHIVVGAVGNSCSGQRTYPTFNLPSGVSPAISAQNPVICWGINFQNNTQGQEPAEPQGACPQQSYGDQTMPYGGLWSIPAINQAQYGYTWPLPQGRAWEFWYPVVSNRQLNGLCPADCLDMRTKMLDGNSSPVLNPTAGLVNDPATAPAGGGGAPGSISGTTPQVTPDPSGGGGGGSGGGSGGTGTTPTPAPVIGSIGAPGTARVASLLRNGFAVSVLVGRAGSSVNVVLSGSPRGSSFSAKRIVIAKASKRGAPAGKATLKLRATRAGKRALRRVRRGRARLTITVTPPGGPKTSRSKLVRLRR